MAQTIRGVCAGAAGIGMIGKGFRRGQAVEETQEEAKGFDAFEMRLGDLMRGERATMGKSLLDVQRELRIKAAYIAAIENCDPSAFDTPGFIAGYVRSYARYLNMDPDLAFATFCDESGFVTAHGMSAEASTAKSTRQTEAETGLGNDIFASSQTPFIPAGEAVLSKIEPAAIGSMVVLVALIGGLGYGGWTVLQEVQRVQFAPVEQTPTVVSEVDPLAGATLPVNTPQDVPSIAAATPSPEAFDRLYRPAPLDVPVLVARDAPISTLTPGELSTVEPVTGVDAALAEAVANLDAIEPVLPAVQVSEDPIPAVELVAVRPAWVRVRSADGTVIFEAIMEKGDTFELPATEEPATLRVGESGGIYFAVNGTHYGPAGPAGQVTSNLALSVDNLTASYTVADLAQDNDLAEVVNVAEVSLSE